MILLYFASLALAIGATMADITENDSANTIKWDDGKTGLAVRTAIYKNYAFFVVESSSENTDRITLTRMNLEGTEHKQEPFPSLAMHEYGNCSALQDVVDIFIDDTGHLWVLDAGNYPHGPCGAKIVAFTATTGQVKTKFDLPSFDQSTRRHSRFSRFVIDHNQKYHILFAYVSDIINRKVHVISGPACNNTIPLPDSPILNEESLDITLNLVRKGNYSLLLINDESRDTMFYLRLEDVSACSEMPEGSLRTMSSANGNVILGNDDLSSVYYREKFNREVVYKYDALDARVSQTEVYRGNPSSLPRHVVPAYPRGGMRLLVTKTLTPTDNIPATGNSLVLV